MQRLPGLQKEVANCILLGLLVAGMGVYILLLVDSTLPGMIVGLLFLAGGVYLGAAAIPFARRLLALLRTGEPIEMRLTVRGRERALALNRDYVVELRHTHTPASGDWDILVYLRPRPGLELFAPGTAVSVYGARERSGPVIIDLGRELLWSSLFRAARRHGSQ
jgi:hypothetical protein